MYMFRKLLLCVCGRYKCRYMYFGLHASNNRKKITLRPVQIAYNSYEGTESYTADLMPPPLIIVHGLCGSKGNWRSLCKAFHLKTSPKRKIIAVDTRNHGDSPHSIIHTYEAMALDIKQFMEAHGIKRASLLGHSMGGRALMLFSLKWPELVENLIVCDISPVSMSANYKTNMKFFEIMRSLDLGKNVPLSTARINADNHLARFISDKGIRAFLLTNLVQQSDGSFRWRINLLALLLNFTDLSTFPEFDGRQFKGPALFISGGVSDYIQKSDHKKIMEYFPGAQFRVVEGAGHWLHSEKPVEFMTIVLETLNRAITKLPSKPT